ncbi:MAG: hypothetical protein Q7S33_01690 [Nanoarchaeota archaeon]|nr:hypothetical protein [Nanoarchaeota archaeon]
MENKYIGIENELKSFEVDQVRSINFGKFMNDSDYKKSASSIRTTTGNGFYIDGQELEILTPPILINKGFATRLTDSLMIGRDRVVKSIPELKHTGYSMHWNLSLDRFMQTQENIFSKEKNSFYNVISIPFHLFALTPLSVGLNMRYKSPRIELLGDSINNEEQINALGLILGAYSYNSKNSFNFPQIQNEDDFHIGISKKLFLPNGRYSPIKLVGMDKEIQAQQYLEMFYKWIEPFVSALGTKKEVQNLEDFIEGRKQLEFDKFKYYSYLLDLNKKKEGAYLPSKELHTSLEQTRERKVPLEGRLLGEIVKQLKRDISAMDWEKMIYAGKRRYECYPLQCNNCANKKNNDDCFTAGLREIQGIREIYDFAETLRNGKRRLKPANLDMIRPLEISLDEFDALKTKGNLEYDLSKDNSLNIDKKINFWNLLGDELKEKFSFSKLVWPLTVALTISGWGASFYSDVKHNHQIEAKSERIIENVLKDNRLYPGNENNYFSSEQFYKNFRLLPEKKDEFLILNKSGGNTNGIDN